MSYNLGYYPGDYLYYYLVTSTLYVHYMSYNLVPFNTWFNVENSLGFFFCQKKPNFFQWNDN